MRNSENFSAILNNSMGFMPTRTAYKLNLRGLASTCKRAVPPLWLPLPSLARVYQITIRISAWQAACLSWSRRTLDITMKKEVYRLLTGTAGPSTPRLKDCPGNGLGVVVLKRLEDALADRDTIYAVIKGWAINNDGSKKVSFMAPSVDGRLKSLPWRRRLPVLTLKRSAMWKPTEQLLRWETLWKSRL